MGIFRPRRPPYDNRIFVSGPGMDPVVRFSYEVGDLFVNLASDGTMHVLAKDLGKTETLAKVRALSAVKQPAVPTVRAGSALRVLGRGANLIGWGLFLMEALDVDGDTIAEFIADAFDVLS